MSGEPPRRSALKRPITKRLRRGVGARHLINAEGRAIQVPQGNEPRRTLMFQNTINVRPFNFRNEPLQAANATENVIAPLINNYNARGNPPIITPNDPRANPEFSEFLGTDPVKLQKSMERNRITRSLGINRPTMNIFRPRGNNRRKQNMKTVRRLVAQYNMGYNDPLMNFLIDKYRMNYANRNNLTDNNIVSEFERPYRDQANINLQVARTAAARNARGGASRKTRRTRK